MPLHLSYTYASTTPLVDSSLGLMWVMYVENEAVEHKGFCGTPKTYGDQV